MTEFYDTHGAGPEWATPRWIWEPLSDALGGFTLDPASGAEEEPIAKNRFTVDDDGLSRRWYGDVWLNPPYSRDLNPKWAEEAAEQYFENRWVDTLTVLVPAATDTGWFQDHYAEADFHTFIRGRVEFEGAGDNSATFASVICSFGTFPDAYVAALEDLGFITRRIRW